MSSLLVRGAESGVVRMAGAWEADGGPLGGDPPQTRECDPVTTADISKKQGQRYRPAGGPSGDVEPCGENSLAASSKPPYSLCPVLNPRLKTPEVLRTTTPDKAIGLPAVGGEKLKAFMNDRHINDLGEFEKYTRELDYLEDAVEFAKHHVDEEDAWIYNSFFLPCVLSGKKDLEDAQILVDAGWKQTKKMWSKHGIDEFTPKLLSGDDLFLWEKSKRPVIVHDNGNMVFRGQIRSTKEEVSVRFIRIEKGHKFFPLSEKKQIEHLLREMSIQDYVHRHLGCCPKVIGLVAAYDGGDNYISLGLVQEFVNCIPGKSFQLTMLDAWKLHVKLSHEGKSLMKESQWLRLVMRVVETAHAIHDNFRCVHFDLRMQNILLQYRDGELYPVLNHWSLALFREIRLTDIQLPSVMITMTEWREKYSYISEESFMEHNAIHNSDLYTIGDQIRWMVQFFSTNTRLFRLSNDMRRWIDIRISYTNAVSTLREMMRDAWNSEEAKPSFANRVKNFIREKMVKRAF